MKEKKIFDAITNVSDELIEEANNTKLKRKTTWYKWTAVAASFLLVLVIGLIYSDKYNGYSKAGAILDVVYPKAYAFEDIDAWWEILEQNPVDDDFIEAVNEFSFKTSASILKDAGKNINYSPLSLYFALSLAASGADGDTQADFLALLNVSDIKTLSEQCGNLYRLLYRDNEISKLKIANSIWMSNEFNGKPIIFKNEFVKNAAENFYATSHSIDFTNKEAGKAMADWISENTNGTLSPVIETNPEQLLTIINTVYFYDEWINRFDKEKTAEDLFHLSNGNTVKVDFMNQTIASASFSKEEGFTRAGLELKNAGKMIFILPDEGFSPYSLISTPEQVRKIFDGEDNLFGEVVWKIPKFSFGSRLNFTDNLKSLGIKSPFEANADFSRITDQLAFITDVHQETHISIDEIGVEASAFTQIDYNGSVLPEDRAEMILNRPFIYGIQSENGILLFVGVCENPAE